MKNNFFYYFGLLLFLFGIQSAKADIYPQIYPPGTFSIDGIPVSCGQVSVILNLNIPDAGIADGRGNIILNPLAFVNLPTPLKFYIFAHECGHYYVGTNEASADCWAVKTGRNQGWLRPQDFQWLFEFFKNNPGDMAHPSGVARVAIMQQCYLSYP